MKKILLSVIGLILLSTCGTGDDTKTYNISVAVSPSDAGSVSPTADSTFEEGQSISLEAVSNKNYNFSNWSGDIDSTTNPLTITVDKDFALTANFEKKNYQLTINTTGEGTVTEEVIKKRTNDYEHGTVLELNANPAEGWEFVEWQGDISSPFNPEEVTMDEPKEISAIFQEKRTSLEGIISTDSTLSMSEEPYEITGNLQVAYGTSLTIEPGVRLYGNFSNFNSDNLIEVFGQLSISGNTESKVSLKKVGINGVLSNSFGSYDIKISHAEIINGGLLFEVDGSFIVRDSFLYELDIITARAPGKDSFIERNLIYNSNRIITRDRTSDIFIQNNLFFNDITNDNEKGYAVENYSGGYEEAETIVRGNTFANINTVAVSLRPGHSSASLNAKENYWSTTSTDKIEDMIYDKKDNLNVSEEIPFEPYLENKSDKTPILPDSLK